jgi:hypothetical protein
MTTIRPAQTEFEIATGANVNTSGAPSVFDAPTPDVTGLEITIPEGDADPRVFAIGETYDLVFQASGGPVELPGATILRSDPLGSDDGVVVFEGTDQGGETVQVVWAPGFDLTGWVEDAQAGGGSARFYTSDQSGRTYEMPCFAAGTAIATPQGPRPVERIRPGDRVLTRDNGPRRVVWSGRAVCPGRGAMAPVSFAPGALGATRPLVLSRQHRVLIADPRAELYFGAAEVFAPAQALADGRAVRLGARSRIVWCHLLLETHDILFAEGAACESLHPGDVALQRLPPGAGRELARLSPGPARGPRAGRSGLARRALRRWEARLLFPAA